MSEPLFTNDAIVFGLLMLSLAFVFYTSSLNNKIWKNFYKVFPPLLMAYVIPSLLNSFGLISSKHSELYTMAKLYLLPASLVLMTLSIDLKAIVNLGPKSIAMFLTGTVGIIIGGPIAILIVSMFSPETVGGVGPDAIWRGLTTIAGSWIGGGANQAAMLEIYGFNQEKYGSMVLVDIIVANIWMAVLLMGIGKTTKIDKWLNADSSAIEELKTKVANYTASISKMPTLKDYMLILGVGFGVTGLSHVFADRIPQWLIELSPSLEESSLSSGFFWLIVISTTLGLIMSFTPAKNLEGAGASKIGSVFIYILVATIGMKMNVLQIFDNPGLLFVGLIWMSIHVLLLLLVAKLIRAPYFFLTVGSQANVGGAASAPIVAAAFSPSLAPVGVLLAVLGYAVGTYGAMFSAYLMELASGF